MMKNASDPLIYAMDLRPGFKSRAGNEIMVKTPDPLIYVMDLRPGLKSRAGK
ncbi:hypothetical protein [Aquirufa sp. Wall-65K1]